MRSKRTQTIGQQIWSWAVVGTIILFILATGIAFMTSGHPYVADLFFLVSGALFLSKFLTWELSKGHKKRRFIQAIAVLITAIFVIGAIYGNHRLNHSLVALRSTDTKGASTEKQADQKQDSESMIKPPPTAMKEPPTKAPPTQQKPQLPLSPPKESPADVALRFVYPKSPALVIANLSDSLARDIKWTVVLWNMDLPDRNDPLPIPVSTFDWLKARDEGGPQDLFNGPLVAPLLKPGNRLFGSVSVDCPACARGRTYIVYIVWGQGGWFSEVENERSGRIIVPPKFLKDSREKYFKALEAAIPENSRLPIGE